MWGPNLGELVGMSEQRLEAYRQEIIKNAPFFTGLIGLLEGQYPQITQNAIKWIKGNRETRSGREVVYVNYMPESIGRPYMLGFPYRTEIITEHWRMSFAFVFNDPDNSRNRFNRTGLSVEFAQIGRLNDPSANIPGIQVDIVTKDDGKNRLELSLSTHRNTPSIEVWNSDMNPLSPKRIREFDNGVLRDTAYNFEGVIKKSGIRDLTGPNYR